MKLSAIFESVRWATGKNITKASRFNRKDQEDGDFTIINVNIADLFAKTNKDQRIDPKTGKGEIQGRRARAHKHWDDGKYMDLSTVSYNKYLQNFDFTDGRHRLITAYQRGERWAPVLVPKDQVEIFKDNMRVK